MFKKFISSIFFIFPKLIRSTGKYTFVETFLAVQNAKTKSLTCVCVISPSDVFKKGLIVTGGNDSVISVFEPDGVVPCQQLCGHRNTGEGTTPTSIFILVSMYLPNALFCPVFS